ncbi:Dph6-related ATP pyrophosphatase [Pedobacter chitinilyticus]|uniref:Diphthine--ammonia ligase n=1 Tax=Pedobacter chitinilyticus TaxID=2233776 RepID=A0A443YV27_9SPHI|nr:diphthine--ammonia ligase [Pedobacter chitinilyticus]RWU07719.1 diphthine--ammonia ligase [Pedobacter chitinilyticus]
MALSVFNWSGGKDSCLALHHILQNQDFEVKYLLTTVNDAYHRVNMHGVRESLLIQQTNSLEIPLHQVRLPEMPDMATYEQEMNQHLMQLKVEGITHAIFGDLFLADLKAYRESKLAEIGLIAEFPLWNRDTREVLKEFLSLGYRTIVVCAQQGLEDFCGRIIDEQFMDDLPPGIDPCGENGEFHTFVFDGPMFKKPIDFRLGEKVFKTFPSPAGESPQGYWYVDLIEI